MIGYVNPRGYYNAISSLHGKMEDNSIKRLGFGWEAHSFQSD